MLKRTCVPGFGAKQKLMEQTAVRLLSLPANTAEEQDENIAKAQELTRAVGQRVQAMRIKSTG